MDFTLYNQFSNALTWLFPKQCMVCERSLKDTNYPCCETCYPELPFQRNSCNRCGQEFSGFSDHCGRCIATPPPYDHCFCPFAYQSPMSELIISLKYRDKPELARDLAALLAREIVDGGNPMPELILPVPLHSTRLRQRGYNQASLLAKHLGKQLNIPVNSTALNKSQASKNQAELSLTARRHNVKGCFSMTESLNDVSVALVDDVVTTGSTVSEIAKILKKKGVDCIHVWGVAHTL